ncbi:MAG: hypothetical protein ABF719_08915 [Acetobacter sp.]|uniref:hypothetical protein n=1 Tax=Acetobacter sp. TaxID=440 RepID=UPI0039EB4AB0
MVSLFGNLPSARDQASDLIFIVGQSRNVRGRASGRGHEIRPKEPFGRLLWYSYGEKDELKDLYVWLNEAAEKNKCYGLGKFHNSETLLRAFETGSCPVSLDDVWLSRSIVLFASLLPKDDCRDLLRVAANQGCQPIIDTYFAQKLLVPLGKRVSNRSLLEAPKPSSQIFPKFLPVKEIAFSSWEASEIVRGQATALYQTEKYMQESRDTAERTMQTVDVSLLDSPQEKWLLVVDAVSMARKATTDFLALREVSTSRYLEMLTSLLSRLKIPSSSFAETEQTTKALATALSEIDAITCAINAVSPSLTVMATWRSGLGACLTHGSLWHLVELAEFDAVQTQATVKFCNDVTEYCKNTDTPSVAAFLTSLDSASLLAIITRISEPPWVAAGAILLRVALDKAVTLSPNVLLSILSHSYMARRALLRFVDPNSSLFAGAIALQRLIAVERFRDIWTFGPIAQISDWTSGLRNIELVGRSVSELIELIVSNLDIVSHGADLVQLLRPLQRDEALKQLVHFIRTPATLTGNFRRLREMAREQFLLPLLVCSPPITISVRKIILGISSGQICKDIIGRFENERPDNRLEARHQEQLERYLEQASSFLNSYLKEEEEQPDSRQKHFIQSLRMIRDNLQTAGELGSIEWLEAEVATILDGDKHAGDDQRTLIGDGGPMLSRLWDMSDCEWAGAFVNLPECHGAVMPRPIEVAASILRWKSRGLLPQTMDVVNYLLKLQNFAEALRVAKDAEDFAAEQCVRESSQEIVTSLQERGNAAFRELRNYHRPIDSEKTEFDAAVSRLDIKNAEEIINFLEFSLEEEKENRLTTARKVAEENERKQDLLTRLHDAGLSDVYNKISLRELEEVWTQLLFTREKERHHLAVTSSAFDKCKAIQPEIVERLGRFAHDVTDPKLWLPEDMATEFSIPLQEIATKIADWVVYSPSFRDEEKNSVLALVGWFLDFVIERSVSFRERSDPAVVRLGIDEVLHTTVAILDASKPSDCVAQLINNSEKDVFGTISSTENNSEDVEIENVVPSQGNNQLFSETVIQDEYFFPQSFLEAVQAQDWRSAVKICELSAKEAISDHAERLLATGRAISSLLDRSTLPSAEVADMFPDAATWLSSEVGGVSLLNDSSLADLGYQLVSGAVAADSGQDMIRVPGVGGTWSELLKIPSPFRRMLTAGLPSRTGRVLEGLLSGPRGLVIAERVWDAATNLPDPQNYRAPLLNLLNDHGAQEIIVKLAKRHDSAIESRLSQLFELRAVAQNRPDLLPVAHSVAYQVASQAKPGPFRVFVRNLPSAVQVAHPKLRVSISEPVQLRPSDDGSMPLEISMVVTPEGLVPATLSVNLFEDDDVTFGDGSHRKILSDISIYFATDYAVALRFGSSWFDPEAAQHDSVRIRIQAKTVTGENIQEDVLCLVRPVDRARTHMRKLDTDTLLELYPGVANTPVVDKAFIGRIDELERLHQVLVSAPNPSPVLLTGMRRIGKTSLLYAFHQRCTRLNDNRAISIYQSLAERRVEFSSPEHSVSRTFFKAISHGLVRPNIPAHDRNHALCNRIRQRFGNDWKGARRAIYDCYDEESLSDSLMVLAERLREWSGWNSRFIFLIDEAEALVVAYQAGGKKKLELEQLLQSLREVSQTTGNIGLLLSGSNHINMFAREYKNAFFGSSQTIELEGFSDPFTAKQVVAPKQIENFIKFEDSAVEYAWELCAGMPQFLWQIGATTAFQIKSGIATRNDVRSAVAMLVGPDRARLPFKPYEMLEPIDSMLSLESPRERDLLWMLLYRVAQASSLAAPDAAIPFVIDQSLLAADDQTGWRRRLRSLVDLKALRMDSTSTVRFQVPLFAESFRAPKNWQEFNIRQQQVAI